MRIFLIAALCVVALILFALIGLYHCQEITKRMVVLEVKYPLQTPIYYLPSRVSSRCC